MYIIRTKKKKKFVRKMSYNIGNSIRFILNTLERKFIKLKEKKKVFGEIPFNETFQAMENQERS